MIRFRKTGRYSSWLGEEGNWVLECDACGNVIEDTAEANAEILPDGNLGGFSHRANRMPQGGSCALTLSRALGESTWMDLDDFLAAIAHHLPLQTKQQVARAWARGRDYERAVFS